MHTMKQVCQQTGISYETLRFYCNEGLVPNVKRDKNNYRQFDQRNIDWLKGLLCLKKCGMGIQDMKQYMHLCMDGKSTIPERKQMLAIQRSYLLARMDEINASIEFIDTKQAFYDDVMSGKTKYTSNLIEVE